MDGGNGREEGGWRFGREWHPEGGLRYGGLGLWMALKVKGRIVNSFWNLIRNQRE